jgi:hypothetical protein
MTRIWRLAFLAFLATIPQSDVIFAQGTGCSPDAAWRRVREAYPVHIQTIAMCEDRANGDAVVVVTEPPHHIVRSKAEAVLRALFASKIKSVSMRRYSLGFDGWAEDAVVVVSARTAAETLVLREDLTLLAQLMFASSGGRRRRQSR